LDVHREVALIQIKEPEKYFFLRRGQTYDHGRFGERKTKWRPREAADEI